MSPVPPPLQIEGLVKSYGDVIAVDGIDLTLGADELVALVGPSGCGKSTVLRTIAGLVRADAGTIRLTGRLVDDGAAHLPPERRSIGLVFQEHALFPHLTVRQNVGFGVRDLSRADVAERVAEVLDLVSLGAHAARYPHELSGGERQRVALARALAPRPALMLFDEPFASLDHNLRVQLRHDVIGALRATSTPAVFVTHFQEEALTIGDRIAVMRSGHIVQLDSPAEIFHQPVDSFVARFMGEASFLRIDGSVGSASTCLGPVDVGPDEIGCSTAMVRPDDVRFTSDVSGDCEVLSAEFHGVGWLARVGVSDGAEVGVFASHLDPPRVGDRGRLDLVPGHRQIVVADAAH